MLSSQTKDEQTSKAMKKLREHGLTVDNILDTEEEDIQDLIYGVGFYRRKAEYIKRTTKIIKEEYEGVVPDELEKVLKFPGVGIKMGLLLLRPLPYRAPNIKFL
jgi:endonuclease-3